MKPFASLRTMHPSSRRIVLTAIVLLGAIFFTRLWLATAFPLTDTTEARYSEIARIMAETGDWVTPQADYGEPYWGKPPLAFWLSAASIKLAGASSLAPRAPILLATVLWLGFIFYWTRKRFGYWLALATVVSMSATVAIAVCSAAVMTDMYLTIIVSVALLLFWNAYIEKDRRAVWAMFIVMGLGALTKGPFVDFLILAPIGAWALWNGEVAKVWQRIPWIRGGLLCMAVALPWFLLAENKTPGFLNYFILGENFGRLLVPEWKGDIYGRAHNQPLGTIWLYFVAGIIPVGPVLLSVALWRRKHWPAIHAKHSKLIRFILCWALTPLLLFTLAPNIIFPYMLPAIPPAILLLVILCRPPTDESPRQLYGPCAALILLLALILAAGNYILADTDWLASHSQQPVLAAVAENPQSSGCQYVYWGKRVFSGEYYSQGKARAVKNPDKLRELLAATPKLCAIVPSDKPQTLPADLEENVRTLLELGDSRVLELGK